MMDSRSLRLLLVEDDRDDYYLTCECLRDVPFYHYEVRHAETVEEAKRLWATENFDVCFVDYLLRKTDGLEFVQWLIEQGCQKPIIMLTGLVDRQLDQRAMRAGVTDYLLKGELTPSLIERTIRYGLERKRIERRMQEAVAAAEQADRVKSHFLATMSHEIRTPMNGVLGMANLLNTTDLTQEQREYVDAVLVSGKSLIKILNDILDLSKVEAGALELAQAAFSPIEMVREKVRLFEAQARESHVQIETKFDATLPAYCEGDVLRIGQVLSNLLGNAIKFTRNGIVHIGLRRILTLDGSARLHMVVRDTGIGISPEHLENIFEAFSQADAGIARQYGGSGLGLAISRQLVRLMGGDIHVESTPGEGATFRVDLPLTAVAGSPELDSDSVDHTEPHAHVKTLSERFPLSILVADDNKINQMVAQRYLHKFGYTADLATNGREALDMAQHQAYDLIFMDLQMPEMDGLEAARCLRAEPGPGGRPIIVALTASAHKGQRELSLDAGMDDFLAKPVQMEELGGIIKKWGKEIGHYQI